MSEVTFYVENKNDDVFLHTQISVPAYGFGLTEVLGARESRAVGEYR